jgi:hypothetical protein
MASAAVALFVLAQPRVFCAVHCMILEPLGAEMSAMPTATASQRVVSHGASGAPMVDMACAHSGTIVTSAPSIPVGSVGPAVLAAIGSPVFGEVRPEVVGGPALLAPVHVAPATGTPPPRA